MDALTIGTDIAVMLTGASALTATTVWVRQQWRGWRETRAARSYRDWHGFIMTGTVNTWYVRLAEQQPDARAGQVLLDVLSGSDGEPDQMQAQGMRIVVEREGMLSRSPTPAEADFLKALHKERGYGPGFPVT